MSKLVTHKEAITLIEEISDGLIAGNPFADYEECARAILEKLPSKLLFFSEGNGETVKISVDATSLGQIGVDIKLGDKSWASSSTFIMNKERHLYQGAAIKNQIAMTLSQFATANEAEYILYALRNVLCAASFLQENPQYALPFDQEPIGMEAA